MLDIIQPRVDHVAIGRINSHGNDLLGKFLDEMHKKLGFINMKLIVDQCKKSLFAGDEPTTHLITSTLTLLSRNPYWQDLVRAEINDLCHGQPPTAQQLRRLGLVSHGFNICFHINYFIKFKEDSYRVTDNNKMDAFTC